MQHIQGSYTLSCGYFYIFFIITLILCDILQYIRAISTELPNVWCLHCLTAVEYNPLVISAYLKFLNIRAYRYIFLLT